MTETQARSKRVLNSTIERVDGILLYLEGQACDDVNLYELECLNDILDDIEELLGENKND